MRARWPPVLWGNREGSREGTREECGGVGAAQVDDVTILTNFTKPTTPLRSLRRDLGAPDVSYVS